MASRKFRSELFMPGRSRHGRQSGAEDIEHNHDMLAIWDAVSLIPRGQVSTYGAVARAAGLPGRARLTGYALRIAPKELHLPWHRVVGAGGRIVFPKTSTQFREQAKRLRAEKVILNAGRVHASCIATLGRI
jgi:methylated-DNA-protein-cysteine methyltransferase related protein